MADDDWSAWPPQKAEGWGKTAQTPAPPAPEPPPLELVPLPPVRPMAPPPRCRPIELDEVPQLARELLGDTPALSEDDYPKYLALLRSLFATEVPRGALDWFLLKNTADRMWEVRCLRRVAAVLLSMTRRAAIETILKNDANVESGASQATLDGISDASYEVLDNDRHALEDFRWVLGRHSLTEADVDDVAFLDRLPVMETIQRLIDSAEARRDALFRELARRRDAFAHGLYDAAKAIDAEFE